MKHMFILNSSSVYPCPGGDGFFDFRAFTISLKSKIKPMKIKLFLCSIKYFQ